MSFDKLTNRQNLYAEVKEYNLIEKIEPLLKIGFRFRKEDGKLGVSTGLLHETPWIAVHLDHDRECLLWHMLLFNYLDVIPSFCLNCWKVVARPNTLDEFFQLHDLMVGWNRPCKIGIEVRAYVQSLYGAYFYNNSLEQGKECLEFVKEQVHTKISPDINVHLKRYCTEFELRHGASDKFVQRPGDREWEDIVHNNFAFDEVPPVETLPDVIKQHIIMKIMEYAAKMKDPTVQKYNNGKTLFPFIVKYDKNSEDPNKLQGG